MSIPKGIFSANLFPGSDFNKINLDWICDELKSQQKEIDELRDTVIDYDDLIDKPSIGGVTLQGNKTLSELGYVVDSAFSDSSTNPVQNKVIKAALDAAGISDVLDLRSAFAYNIGNIVNEYNTIYGWINGAGWRSSTIDGVYKQRVSEFIAVTPGETYTAFLIASQAFRICVSYYSDNKDGNTAFISQDVYNTYNEINGERYNKYVFTIPVGCTYIRVYYYTCDEQNYYLFNTTVKTPLGLVALLEKYFMPTFFEKLGYVYPSIEQGTFSVTGLNQASSQRVRTVEYIPVIAGQKYIFEAIPADQTKILKISASFYDADDYETARISFLNYVEAPTTITIPSSVTYIRCLIAYSNDANITPADVSAFFVKKVYPKTGISNYLYGAGFEPNEFELMLLGALSGEQSFCKYNNKYYSTDGGNLYVQLADFSLESTTALNLGHANALQLGHNGKVYASGWNDQKVYEVDIATKTIVETYTLPTTGYTTVAVDDINKLMYIFQRDTYPDTLENYNFITYDYDNEQVISTKKTTVEFGGMQAVDFIDGKIFVVNGFGNATVPNGYRVYNTNGDVIAEYVIGTQATVEPEGVFVDRDTKEIYLSYVNKSIYKINF